MSYAPTKMLNILRKIGALQFGEFTLASGAQSSFYLDLRYLPAFPEVFKQLIEDLSSAIVTSIDYDTIIGIPSAGTPFATGLAYHNTKPVQIMRKEPKTHGLKRQVEGPSIEGKKVLLVDDLISSGFSKEFALDVIESEGGKVTDLIVVVDRSEGKGDEWSEKRGIRLHSLVKLTADEIMNFSQEN